MGGGELQKPPIANAYLRFLKTKKDAMNDIMLPGQIEFFNGKDGKCSTVVQAKSNIRLKWKDIPRVKEEVKDVDYSDCSYRGTVDSEGRRDGWGKLTFRTGTTYEGNFIKGTYEGYGTMVFASGNKYSGEWKNGLRGGYGESTYANGDRYLGCFETDKKHGEGTYFYKNGNTYQGGWC